MYVFYLLISVSISRISSKFQLYGVVIRPFRGDIVHFVSYLEYINTLILNMTWFKGKGAKSISEVPPDWPKSHFLIGNLVHCTCICTCIYKRMYMYIYIITTLYIKLYLLLYLTSLDLGISSNSE